MTQWSSASYRKWISDGCDIKSAAEVECLIMDGTTNLDLRAGLLKHFVNLHHLSMSFCGLTTIPDDVWELTQLKGLYIIRNSICEISPKIKNLTNLHVFKCEGNNLTAFPVELCQLTKLVFFTYHGNKLDVLDPDVVDFITIINKNFHINELTLKQKLL